MCGEAYPPPVVFRAGICLPAFFPPNGPGASPRAGGVLRRGWAGRGEPVVEPGQQLRLQRRGRHRGEHRRAGQLGPVGVGLAVRVAGDLVQGGQPRGEEQRVVGTERDRHAGLEQAAQRDLRRDRRDAERDVGGRAYLAGDPAGG